MKEVTYEDWKGYVKHRGKASCERCRRHHRLLYASSCEYGSYFRRLEEVYGLGESYGCKYYCQYNIDSAYGGLAFGAVILNLFDRDEDSGDDYEY